MKNIKFTTAKRLLVELDSRSRGLEREGFKFHHFSIARGYEPVRFRGLEEYEGRYGKGFVLHLPTLISSVKGNRWHRIYYFIKTK